MDGFKLWPWCFFYSPWWFAERFKVLTLPSIFCIICGWIRIYGFSPLSHRNQGWLKLSLADIRDIGLMSSKDLTKSLAYSLTKLHSFWDIEYFPNLIFMKTSVAFFPVNGMYPLSRMYSMTPIDHKSHFAPYFNELFNTSGAT